LQAVEVPAKSVNKKGIKESKISTDLLSSKVLPSQPSAQKGTFIVGTIELPLKSKQPANGLSSMKKQTKRVDQSDIQGFYHTNAESTLKGSARSLSAKSRNRSASKKEGSPTHSAISKQNQSKLSRNKEYGQKVRELNKKNQTSIIKSAQRILYSSRSVKNYDASGKKNTDETNIPKGQSVSSFVQDKPQNEKNSPSKLNKGSSPSKESLDAHNPKGAQRIKPEGSLCMHRKGYKPTPADMECTFKPTINKQSRFLDEKKQNGGFSPISSTPRHESLINKVNTDLQREQSTLRIVRERH
jgi:hypothetical protein